MRKAGLRYEISLAGKEFDIAETAIARDRFRGQECPRHTNCGRTSHAKIKPTHCAV